ncbi:hypothetical protein [Rhizobium sp. Root1220]|uniref:hypothetical protein n=1 Tax=Rhizobium sp. Root1220 TaxID=1736432 RepID=UPI0006F80E63|nr:hypothetical protein [Rhizobium sp. Root1220]KQV84106.1 hypothetical protein ASC90_00860 [Rhizobium sp. Root1220]
MPSIMVRVVVVCGLAATLAGCVDRANAPILVPVAAPLDPPLNPQGIAHGICVADGNFMYNEARKQYELRARMTNTPIDVANEEVTATAAARRQYVTCLSSQGYRVVQDG